MASMAGLAVHRGAGPRCSVRALGSVRGVPSLWGVRPPTQISSAAPGRAADGRGEVRTARRWASPLHDPSPSTRCHFKVRRF